MDINDKYRPKHFDEVVGHSKILRTLKGYLADTTLRPHSYMFAGPPGVGKTTLARILALELGCKPFNIMEQDGVTQATVEPMRELVANLRYPAMGGSPLRALILNEAHMLTASTWKSLLQDIEEPPAHLFWIFCTTQPEKIPEDVVTRVIQFNLRPLSDDVMMGQLTRVCSEESIVYQPGNLESIVAKSQGSMRKALGFISMLKVSGGEDLKELISGEASPEIGKLFNALMKDTIIADDVWHALERLKGSNPEAIRQSIVSRLASAWKKSDGHIALLYECFKEPMDPLHGMLPLSAAIMRFLKAR